MDRRLRDLERRAEVSPEAGAAYAAELARLGERRAAYLTWCRLAREGLEQAEHAVRGWPRFSQTRCAITADAPDDPGAGDETQVRGHTLELPDSGVCFAATATTLYLLCGPFQRERRRVVAVDLRSGKQVWASDEGEAPFACVGDDVLVHRGNSLVLRDHRSGALLGHLQLTDQTSSMVAHRDRLVVLEGERTRGYDLGDAFGELLWDRATGTEELGHPTLAASAGLLYAYSWTTVEVSELDTGLTQWRQRGCRLLPTNQGRRFGNHVVAGDGGLIVREESSELGTSRLSWIGGEQTLRTHLVPSGPSDGGGHTAGFPQGHLALVTQGGGRIAFLRREGDGLELECVALAAMPLAERDDASPSAPLWSRAIERCDDLLLQGDRLYLLVVERTSIVMRALDARTGRQVYRVRVKTDSPQRWPVAARLIPVAADSLLAALCVEKELQLVRFALQKS